MTMANIFGKQFELSPDVFAGLPDHGKSELCRLLREIGWPVVTILDFCGIKAREFNDLYFATHSVDLGAQLRDRVILPDGDLTTGQKDNLLDSLSMHHCRLLVRFPHNGLAYWKNQHAMEMEAGLKFGNGPKIMETLYESKLVERAAPRRGFEQCWALTALGADLRATINPDDVQSEQKAK